MSSTLSDVKDIAILAGGAYLLIKFLPTIQNTLKGITGITGGVSTVLSGIGSETQRGGNIANYYLTGQIQPDAPFGYTWKGGENANLWMGIDYWQSQFPSATSIQDLYSKILHKYSLGLIA